MAIIITYGIGGYCETCSSEHNHPLNNIIEIQEIIEETTVE